ncbi:MAG: alpha/beta-hydrolase family protein, partial [Actinoplanes sp.]
VVGPLAGLVFLALGTRWQQELRERLGMPRLETYDILRIIGVGVLTFAVLLLVARLIRLGTRALVRLLARWVPRPVAYGVGLTVAVYVVVGFFTGFLFDNMLAVADRTASLTNGGTSPGVSRPESGYRAGGPGSGIEWNTLGRQGRDFVATGPSTTEIASFTGEPALVPIRVYAGLDSADSPGERARAVVGEMRRTGAFDRAVIAVVTPTGTGWVDSAVTDGLEYMYGGDTALVSMQYSYLPSWISFLVDDAKVRESARALIDAVRTEWLSMPAQERPKLLLFGESLGSFGTESAYPDLVTMASGADGVLLVGPPFANPIRRELMPVRQPGSPIWEPDFGTWPVEFARDPADLRDLDQPVRVVYLQNSSVPIVWWTPELLMSSPDWLDHPRGPDISPDMHWYPGVTFWQTAVDQVFANSVPAGHGHVYGSGVADGWAALAAPAGWTDADTVRLRLLLDETGKKAE